MRAAANHASRPAHQRVRSPEKAKKLARVRSEAAYGRICVENLGAVPPPGKIRKLRELYDFAKAELLSGRGVRQCIKFEGISYPVEVTNIGRLRVLDPDTRELLISGSPGALF